MSELISISFLRSETILIFDSGCSVSLFVNFFESIFKFSFFQISILSSEKSGVKITTDRSGKRHEPKWEGAADWNGQQFNTFKHFAFD